MIKSIPAGKFKAECLRIMDDVNRTKQSIVITKRDVPVAELIPIDRTHPSVFGCMKGSVEILGDITKPVGEEWDANR